MKKYRQTLNLTDDKSLTKGVNHWHNKGKRWQEVNGSIIMEGVVNMRISRIGNPAVIIIEADDYFDLMKAFTDAGNPKERRWKTWTWDNLYIRLEKIFIWQRKIMAGTDHLNVLSKISCIVIEADSQLGQQLSNFTLYLNVAWEAFGSILFMLGPDYPVYSVACGYQKWIAILNEYT